MTDASPHRPGASAPTPAPTATPATEPQQFINRLRACLADRSFVQLGLARPHGTDPTLQKLLARRVVQQALETSK